MEKTLKCILFAIVLCLCISCSHEPEGPVQPEQTDLRPELASSYVIVTPAGANQMINASASRIATGLQFFSDDDVLHQIVRTTDDTPETTSEILLHNTCRADSASYAQGLGPMDYVIAVTEQGKIVIAGGSVASSCAGADRFVELVKDGTLKSSSSAYFYRYRFSDAHVSDPLSDWNSSAVQSFLTDWKSRFTSPAWGGENPDMREHLYALSHNCTGSEGRTSTIAHRGDMKNYPENSLAGIISAILSGADTVEMDFRFTKDFIPVLFHDSTLTRTTDFSSKKGKNGLPTSPNIRDWTYDQLLQLNLLDYYGNVTSYKIPLIYDALALAGGRIQAGPDDKDNTDLLPEELFIPLAKASGSCSCLLFTVMRKYGNADCLEGLVNAGLIAFAESCAVSGKFKGSYGYFSNEELLASLDNNYQSIGENAEIWDAIRALNKYYIATNICNELAQYMTGKGMTAWAY